MIATGGFADNYLYGYALPATTMVFTHVSCTAAPAIILNDNRRYWPAFVVREIDEKREAAQRKKWRFWHAFTHWPQPKMLCVAILKAMRLRVVQERYPAGQRAKNKRRAYLQNLRAGDGTQ